MKYLTLPLAVLMLTACTTTTAPTMTAPSLEQVIQAQWQKDDDIMQLTVNAYSQSLVYQLVVHWQQTDPESQVAVTNFTFVDSALEQGSILSNHLSEAMMHDLHTFGVPVLDYKATDYIRVTEQGDFVLSRNYEELSDALPIRYVVTGTMTQHQLGMLINARLVRIDNKQVMSVARTFIPEAVVSAIIRHNEQVGLQLKQG
ncbi:FlgO family outer membrane protein [Rheinheimera sp. MMS21-TC3]|uniref:FlgO family outer membrane protein n=1 Tax=Rheinheimera sp. MMS21-TC3 TaxID=3072790 RepID=UPI0028C4E195|nr:FlgO family outer membrane protein [Rheinheimera sp. MMS21-TC3]WNO61846.1 FlgO family outer membrane protein [Rheinheimera sp. MMS21-TC3]